MMNSGRTARAIITGQYILMIEDICARMKVSESDRFQALLPLYHALFSFSLFAGDGPLFEQALNWLRENDASFLSPWPRRMKTWMARFAVFRQALAIKHEALVAIDEWRRYRPGVQQARSTDP